MNPNGDLHHYVAQNPYKAPNAHPYGAAPNHPNNAHQYGAAPNHPNNAHHYVPHNWVKNPVVAKVTPQGAPVLVTPPHINKGAYPGYQPPKVSVHHQRPGFWHNHTFSFPVFNCSLISLGSLVSKIAVVFSVVMACLFIGML